MSTIEIAQFACLSDNYGYLFTTPRAGKRLVSTRPKPARFCPLDARGWTLSHIWNTHHHFDHAGNNLRSRKRPAVKLSARQVRPSVFRALM